MRCRSPSACSSCHPMTIGNDRCSLNPRREARSHSGPGSLCSVRERVAVAPVDADGLDWLAGTGDGAGVAGDAGLRSFLSELREHLKDLTAELVASSLNCLLSEVDQAARTDECGDDRAESVVKEVLGWEWNRRLARNRGPLRRIRTGPTDVVAPAICTRPSREGGTTPHPRTGRPRPHAGRACRLAGLATPSAGGRYDPAAAGFRRRVGVSDPPKVGDDRGFVASSARVARNLRAPDSHTDRKV
jgi:hypothetical protein